jgi:large subunit ribosomal protein L7e
MEDASCASWVLSSLIAYSSSQAQKEKRGVIFKRAEKYVKEYRDQEREKIRLSRLAKQDGSFYIPAEEKLVFVIRIKG